MNQSRERAPGARTAFAGAALTIALLLAGPGEAVAAPLASSVAAAPASGGPPTPGTVFVANNIGQSITEYAPGASGNATPTATISGSNTKLVRPMTLALDPAGDLFVDDQDAQAILEYAPGATGNVAPTADISGTNTGLDFPEGVALDSAGDIFAANEGPGSVTEYAPGANGNATPTATIPASQFGGNDPTGVAVNAAGDLFVSSGISESVYEFAPPFTSKSTPIATITGSNTGLANPQGLSFGPSGDLFVSNFYVPNPTVTEYAPGASGNVAPLAAISVLQPGATGVDASGDLFVPSHNDSGDFVYEFTPPLSNSSTPAGSITGSNTNLDVPDGVAIALPGPPAKLAFVTEPTGSLAGRPLVTQPAVAIEDANGNVIPTNTSPVTLSITPGTGTSGASVTCSANPVAASAGTATFSGCAINKAGPGYQLHATDGSLTPADSTAFPIVSGFPPPLGAIFVLSAPDNALITEYAPGSNGNVAPVATINGSNTRMNGPVAMAVDAAGHIFVASQNGNSVEEFAPGADGDPGPIATITGPDTGLHTPSGLAINDAGDLIVANGSAPGTITEYAPNANGDATPIATITSASLSSVQLNNLALDSSGDVFVTSENHNEVFEFAPNAGLNATPIATISGSNTALNGPDDVAVDSAGQIFIANDGAVITEYATGANGNAAPKATISGSNTGLASPFGLELDPAGDLFVADQRAGNVFEFAPGASGNVAPIATITGSNTQLVGPSDLAIVEPGPPAKLAFVRQPKGAKAGEPLATQPAVAVQDAEGNLVTTATSPVTLSITRGTGTSGAGLTCAANPVTGSAGIARFSGCAISEAGKGYQLHATDGSLTPADSAAFTIGPPPPAIDHFRWKPDPIAEAGTLAPGRSVDLTVTALEANGKPFRGGLVYLSLTRALIRTKTGKSPDEATASCGRQKLPAYCRASNKGQVRLTYTSSRVLATGADTLTAAVDPYGTDQATDQYFYPARAGSKVTRYAWTPDPIAPAGTIKTTKGQRVTFTALTSDGNPVPRAPVKITFTQAPGSDARVTPPAGCTAVSGKQHEYRCATDQAGHLIFTYARSIADPLGGSDALTGTTYNGYKQKGGTKPPPPPSATDVYSYQAIDHFGWSPDPVAAAGSLKPSGQVQLTVTAFDAHGKPVRGALVYLSLTRAQLRDKHLFGADSATASCGTKMLPAYCLANGRGQVDVTYTSSRIAGVGSDTLTAAVDPYGTSQATDHYFYLAAPGTAVARYAWSPDPIALAASLKPGSSAPVTLTALSADGNPIPGAGVVIALKPGPGSTAKISAPSGACQGGTSKQPALDCRTSRAGILSLTYQSSSAAQQGGSDGLTARPPPKMTHPPAPALDIYSYQAIDHFTWSQDPVAAPGSLKPRSQVQLTVTAFNAADHPVPDALVYLSLTRAGPATGPNADNAIASCGNKVSLPGYCPANTAGQVTVTYADSAHPYQLGSDTLTAAVDPYGTNQASDEYTYLARPGTAVASYRWSPDPIAEAASLAAGTTVPVTLTALSASGNPIPGATVLITFIRAPGSTATVRTPAGCTTLAGKELRFKCGTGKAGDLTLTFKSSKSRAQGGSDAITATTGKGTTPAAAPPKAIDVYSYD